jgi:hypothetical protein
MGWLNDLDAINRGRAERGLLPLVSPVAEAAAWLDCWQARRAREVLNMRGRGEPSDIKVGAFYVREGGHLVIDVAQAPSVEEVENLQVQYAYEQGRLAERATIAARRRFRRSAWRRLLLWLSFIGWGCLIGWLLQAVLTR